MDSKLKKLIESRAIICGRISKENGIVRFERIKSDKISDEMGKIEKIPENERAYATNSMGRAVFSIDEKGKTHNFKGVDSHLDIVSELGTMNLVNAEACEYIQNGNPEGYRVSAVIFNGEKPEIRINGTSPLEDVEIEGDVNKKLTSMGIKVPYIKYIQEIPQEYSLKYGLPIKVNGSMKDFECRYDKQDDERKARLEKNYGENYTQEIEENQRPETMSEYLKRIGFFDSDKIKENVERKGYSIEEFAKAVDESYSRGQRYGQSERIMDNPFRISDLEICISNENIEQLKAIVEFSENNEKEAFKKLGTNLGKNVALLMNNGWECENLVHLQDFSLAGEFCDDSYFDILEREEQLKEEYKGEEYKVDAFEDESKRKYLGQVMHVASCVKVVQSALQLLGREKEETDKILTEFVGSFTENLDYSKIGELLEVDKEKAEDIFLKEFSNKQDWTKKISKRERAGKIIVDNAEENFHKKNEKFYSKVSKKIGEKMIERQAKEEKSEKYSIDNIFKVEKNDNKKEEVSLIEIEKEKWYGKY